MLSQSSGIVIGDARAAKEWVTSSFLAEESKQVLLRFIARFPNLTYYQNHTDVLDRLEALDQIILPRWFRTFYHTLTFVMPDHHAWVRFNGSLHPVLTAERLREQWFKLNALGFAGEPELELLAQMRGIHPYPVVDEEGTGGERLAINLADHTDQHVYAYTFESILDNRSGGFPIEDSVFVMFATYAEMFERIIAIKLLPRGDDARDEQDERPAMIIEGLS